CVITGTHTVFPSKSNASFLDKKSKSYDSGNPNSLKPSLIVKFLIPSGSRLGTPSLLTSIATKVGVISYGDKILLYSNDNLPVTILYPFGFDVSGTLLLFLLSFGCSYFNYPFLTSSLSNSSICSSYRNLSICLVVNG